MADPENLSCSFFDSVSSPQCDWSACFYAQAVPSDGIEANTDMDGIAVGVANIALSICLPILIYGSDGDVISPLFALMWQQFSILLAAVTSINRGQLSIFDANFAVLVTGPPFSALLTASAFDDLFGSPNSIFSRCGKWRTGIRSLTFLYIVLWFVIVSTQTLSDTAFTDSYLCGRGAFAAWVKSLFWQFVVFLFPFLDFFINHDSLGLFTIAQWGLVAVYFFRHRRYIIKQSKAWWASRPRGSAKFTSIRFFTRLLALHVEIIYEAHPWLASAFVISTNIIWGVRVYQSTRIAMESTDYSLSYGQILSIFAVVTPVLSTIRLAWSSRDYLLDFLKRLPGEILDETIFVLTGHRDPLQKYILPATKCSSSAQPLLSCSSVSATTSPNIPASSTSDLPPPPPPARHRSSPFIPSSQSSELSTPIPWPSFSTGVLSTLSSPEVSSIRRRTSSMANISDPRSNDMQHRHRISTSTSAGTSLPDGVGDSRDNSLQPVFANGQLSESPPESPHATDSVADAMYSPAHVVSSPSVDGQSEYFDARSTTSSDTVRLIQRPGPKTHSASAASTHPTMTPFAYRSLTAPSTGKLSWSGARRRFLTDAEKRRA